jgi:hypothetical protein
MATALLGRAVAQEPPALSLIYRVPTTITVRQPVVVELSLTTVIELGRNTVGNFQLKLRRPNGKTVVADPRRAKRADEGYSTGSITLNAGNERVEHIILDEWFGSFDAEGDYQLTIDFIGAARTSGRDVNLDRTATLKFEMLPRNPAVLAESCEQFTHVARTSKDASQARFAAKRLAFVRDPIAVEYLERVIEQGKALEIYDVEAAAIRALERMATPDARDALLRARLKSRPVAANEINDALIRMLRGVK